MTKKEKQKEYLKRYKVQKKSTPEGRVDWTAAKSYDNAVKRTRKYGGFVETDKHEIKRMRALYRHVKWLNHLNPYMPKMEIDHVIAISDGGSHTMNNLQVLRREENMKKRPKGLRSKLNPVLPPKGSRGRGKRSSGKGAARLPLD